MSTRKGTVKFLDDILDEATEVMHDAMRANENKYAQVEDPEKTSEVIGSTAVKIQDMAGRRYVFLLDLRRQPRGPDSQATSFHLTVTDL